MQTFVVTFVEAKLRRYRQTVSQLGQLYYVMSCSHIGYLRFKVFLIAGRYYIPRICVMALGKPRGKTSAEGETDSGN
jgi:hypothetical protein